jgi:hypothetical protein
MLRVGDIIPKILELFEIREEAASKSQISIVDSATGDILDPSELIESLTAGYTQRLQAFVYCKKAIFNRNITDKSKSKYSTYHYCL